LLALLKEKTKLIKIGEKNTFIIRDIDFGLQSLTDNEIIQQYHELKSHNTPPYRIQYLLIDWILLQTQNHEKVMYPNLFQSVRALIDLNPGRSIIHSQNLI
jgi:hypothetical protein